MEERILELEKTVQALAKVSMQLADAIVRQQQTTNELFGAFEPLGELEKLFN